MVGTIHAGSTIDRRMLKFITVWSAILLKGWSYCPPTPHKIHLPVLDSHDELAFPANHISTLAHPNKLGVLASKVAPCGDDHSYK